MLLCLLFLSIASLPAQAEQTRKSSLAYTTMGYKMISKPSTPKPQQPTPPTPASAASQAEPPEQSNKVWKKYRRLAAGVDRNDAPAKKAEATPASAESKPQSAGGFAAILQKWRESQETRGTVRSLSINN